MLLIHSGGTRLEPEPCGGGGREWGEDEDVRLLCPITGELFKDPVLCVGDGHTYEREAVEKWFAKGHSTSPLTGAVLSTLDLVPNLLARGQVDDSRMAGQAHRPSASDVPAQGQSYCPGDVLLAEPVASLPRGKHAAGPFQKGRGKHPREDMSDEGPAGPSSPEDSQLLRWVCRYPVPHSTREDAKGRVDKRVLFWFRSRGFEEKWPLHGAAMRGDVEAIRTLTSRGERSVSELMTDYHDSVPLGWAAAFGQLSAVIVLIQLGADPLRENKRGDTTLEVAVLYGHIHVIRFLREYRYRAKAEAPISSMQILREQVILGPPKWDEESWGIVACPVYGHPRFDEGAYHSVLGCCCTRNDRKLIDTSACEDSLASCFELPFVLLLYVITCAYQPCGLMSGAGFPWLGDCPCTVQRVTRNYVEQTPCCLVRGVAKERLDAGLSP